MILIIFKLFLEYINPFLDFLLGWSKGWRGFSLRGHQPPRVSHNKVHIFILIFFNYKSVSFNRWLTTISINFSFYFVQTLLVHFYADLNTLSNYTIFIWIKYYIDFIFLCISLQGSYLWLPYITNRFYITLYVSTWFISPVTSYNKHNLHYTACLPMVHISSHWAK